MEEIISELIADDKSDKLEDPAELSQERVQNKLKEVEDDGDDPGTASSVR